MNAKQILALGVSLFLLVLALAFYQSCTRTVATPGRVAELVSQDYQRTLAAAAAALRRWGGDQVTVNVQNDSLGVKPIGELALAKIRVRSIVDYSDATLGSTKRIIAHEAFDVKIGWDVNSDIVIRVNRETRTVTVTATRPRVLSVTHADREPHILLSEDGVLNKLTPADMVAVQRQLEAGARAGDELREGMATATEGFKQYFGALFGLPGYTVTFDFSGTNTLNPPGLSLPGQLPEKSP